MLPDQLVSPRITTTTAQMGCRCCRMIRRYIFGPTIIRELPPNSVKNEKNYRNNDIKHETSFHNRNIKTNNIVTSTLDKVINLEEQNIEIIRKEINVSEKNLTRAEEKTVEGIEHNTDKDEIHTLNNKLLHPESYTVAEHDEIVQNANTENCSLNNNLKDASKDELAQHHDPETESDCHKVNGPSTEHPTEAENMDKACHVHEGGEETIDNKEIDFPNNGLLLHVQNAELNQYNLETDTDEIKTSSNQSSDTEMYTINGHEDLGNTPPITTDEELSVDLFEEVKLRIDGEDPEVAAALAALEAATAGEDDDLED
ncbi:uncharacterized protein LOC132819636 isoform X1 [Hemiscyllium ocellatum]|uniref:uncharacterized protein LOC132819636 isoform X1 n=2 Tax=Hemiscyllium ocellatum TaxID=170820 RepID=UPI002966F416|nr:uncharacterized protein LOC132819636 isoform X1 [Hemiscyllium ocellatum]XP_060687220.1 uncharacterized protein LOC132819636 isoform X1 [Hemiscyllium ocellatum]XP_060687229.1 uncharacterized protein LOC132819636 isoform X1 [Hemiscyllium ocellatum]XP_060687238.1 uncharacterized protein LOC132819636 isoform X1 [Hemiscyllium ocellatum]